jgi:hypothetical protein
MSANNIGFWNSGSINNKDIQNKLQAYASIRSRFNDSSVPALVDLVNAIINNMNSLQQQVNTGSLYVNKHTHQTVPPAHTSNIP